MKEKDTPKYLSDLSREERDLIVRYRMEQKPDPEIEKVNKQILDDLIKSNKLPAEMISADKSKK